MADATTKIVSSSAAITHIGNGSLIAAGGISASTDVSTALDRTGNLGRYPRCDVALMIAPTASIASTSQNIYLYRRDRNIDGTNHAGEVTASNKTLYVGSFIVPYSTTASTTHYLHCTNVPLPGSADCSFVIESGLGVNIPAGWTLKVKPISDEGATS